MWDCSAFIGYTIRGIMDGVDDGLHSGRLSVLSVHSSYLCYPAFFRKLAGKLEVTASHNWWRS